MTRVLIAGIGNVLMTDDGIGPYCARQLMAGCDFPPDVEVADLGTPGLDLTLHLSEADTVIVVDALRDGEPGTLSRYDVDAVSAGAVGIRLETHSPALAESIQIARLSGDRPRDVRLIGLTGVSFDHGTTLSLEVRARMPLLIDAVLAELTGLQARWKRRTPGPAPDVWWEQPALRDA